MSLFVAGVHHRRHPVVALEQPCPKCHRVSVRLGIFEKRALHLFWVPILPLGSGKRYVCLLCGGEEKTRKLAWDLIAALPPSTVHARLADLNAYYATFLAPQAPSSRTAEERTREEEPGGGYGEGYEEDDGEEERDEEFPDDES